MSPLKKKKPLPFCCRLPYGSQPLLTDGVPLQINEGYLEEATTENGVTRHAFLAAVDKQKLIPLFNALVEKLGPAAYAILELPPEDESEYEGQPAGPEGPVDVYLSAEFDKAELLEGLKPYQTQLLLDGLVGFGLATPIHPGPPARVREVFVDEHKLVRIHDEAPGVWREVFAKFEIPRVTELHSVDMVPHVHQALDQFPENELPPELRRAPLNELVWEEYISNLLESLQFEKQSPASAAGAMPEHPVHETVH